MPALLAALLAATQAPPSPTAAVLGGTAQVFSTVGHSEWCPAGNVTLDLRTGRYALTPTAPRRVCENVGLERPVRKGRLAGRRLTAVRAAYLRVLSEGLESPVCQAGRRPQDYIVVSNGGTPILVVTSGRGSLSAPDELTCWSEAASGLHDILDEAFGLDLR
jgi:hypothetical protein